jgi:hypothetical protein
LIGHSNSDLPSQTNLRRTFQLRGWAKPLNPLSPRLSLWRKRCQTSLKGVNTGYGMGVYYIKGVNYKCYIPAAGFDRSLEQSNHCQSSRHGPLQLPIQCIPSANPSPLAKLGKMPIRVTPLGLSSVI